MPENTKSKTAKIHTINIGILPAFKGIEQNASATLAKRILLIGYIKGYSSKVVAKIYNPSLSRSSMTICAVNMRAPPP